jgi:hypothetical protein
MTIPQQPISQMLEKCARSRFERSPWFMAIEVPGRTAPLMRAMAWDELTPEARENLINETRLDLTALLDLDERTVEAMFKEIGYRGLNRTRDCASHAAAAFKFGLQHILDEGGDDVRGSAPDEWKVQPGSLMPSWLRVFNGDGTWRMADGLSVPGAKPGDLDWASAGIDVSTPSGPKHAAPGDTIVFDGARFDVRPDCLENQKR